MFFMAIHYPESTLKIMDYNRVLKSLNGLSAPEFLSKVGESYSVEPLADDADPKPTQKGECTLYLDKHWYRLRVKAEKVDPNCLVK
jgi:uncharacterized protein (DUF1015 family)